MAVSARTAHETFTREQVGEVIGLATELERLPTDETLSYAQLIEVARELGISPATVGQAVERWQADRRRRARASVRSLKRRVRRYRQLRRFYRHIAVYLTAVVGLALLDWASGPGWWIEWVLFGWGTLLALHGIRLLLSKHGAVERLISSRYLAA